MKSLLWAGVAAFMLSLADTPSEPATPVHLSTDHPSIVMDLAETVSNDVVLVEVVEVRNPQLAVFYVKVEQSCAPGPWRDIGRLVPFPLDQGGRHIVKLARLSDDRLPDQIRLSLQPGEETISLNGVSLVLKIQDVAMHDDTSDDL